jgi:23S rRNA (adenine2030-N6)-methyltransferase
VLSYQHDYHAGNHADVLKHSVLAILIRALQRKPAPIRIIDSHAGSGLYDLEGALAQHGREFEHGAARALAAPRPPPSLAPYLEVLRALNPDGALRSYPGSPQLSLSLLREHDQLELFELHPQAAAALHTRFRRHRQVHIHRRDGFEGLVAVLPPKERRGIALIDPSYEHKHEFTRAADVLARAYARWAGGVFAVWYPLIRHAGSTRLIANLGNLELPRVFLVELEVTPDAAGLRGSGLVIVNLPYQTDRELGELLPWLRESLGREGGGAWRAEWLRR